MNEAEPDAASGGECSALSEVAMAQLLGLQESRPEVWKERDLAGIFRHQMETALEGDLVGAGVISAEELRNACEGRMPKIVTFGDLLGHDMPPLEGLRAVKQFAKFSVQSEESSIPHVVARALYFAATGAAQVRCGERMTSLSEEVVRAGWRWVLSLAWVGEPVCGVVRAAVEMEFKGGA